MTDYISKGAVMSRDLFYRYRLWREWRGTATDRNWEWVAGKDGKPAVDGAGHRLGSPVPCLFIMLNPSTADHREDDPTIRRCVNFAKAWGYDRLEVVNLFGYRTKDPEALLSLTDRQNPVGRENPEAIKFAADRAGIIIAAWGAHGSFIGQDETVLGWLEEVGAIHKLHALALTKDGHPRHPLYLRADVKPFRWEGRAR